MSRAGGGNGSGASGSQGQLPEYGPPPAHWTAHRLDIRLPGMYYYVPPQLRDQVLALVAEYDASRPRKLFVTQVLSIIRSNPELQDTYYPEEIVVARWAEQGLDDYVNANQWGHEEIPEPGSSIYEAPSSILSDGIYGDPDDPPMQPRNPDRSRPLQQFTAQVAIESRALVDLIRRDGLLQLSDYGPDGTDFDPSTPVEISRPDIGTLAYRRVRNRWLKWRIWDMRWGILPGLSWKHEQYLDDFVRERLGEAAFSRLPPNYLRGMGNLRVTTPDNVDPGAQIPRGPNIQPPIIFAGGTQNVSSRARPPTDAGPSTVATPAATAPAAQAGPSTSAAPAAPGAFTPMNAAAAPVATAGEPAYGNGESASEYQTSEFDCGGSNIENEEPFIGSEEHSVGGEEPTIKVEEPTIKVEEPTIKIEEPTIKIEEPDVDMEELIVKNEEPVIGSEEHSVGGGEPTIKVEEPDADMEEPVVKNEELLEHEASVMEQSESGADPVIKGKEPATGERPYPRGLPPTRGGNPYKVTKPGSSSARCIPPAVAKRGILLVLPRTDAGAAAAANEAWLNQHDTYSSSTDDKIQSRVCMESAQNTAAAAFTATSQASSGRPHTAVKQEGQSSGPAVDTTANEGHGSALVKREALTSDSGGLIADTDMDCENWEKEGR